MDAPAELFSEHVVHQTVLGDPAEPVEAGSRYDSVEVMAVAGNLRAGLRNPGLDASLQFLGGSIHEA